MSSPIKQLGELGQSLWYDNIDRRLLQSGGMQQLIDAGVSGLTSYPTIFEKAVNGSDVYDRQLEQLWRQGLSPAEIYDVLLLDDIAAAADLFRPLFEASRGADGYVSIEPRPALAYDTEATIAEVRRLHRHLNRPNVMIKVPATREGVVAVEALIAEGININITLMFSLDHYQAVAAAYLAGLERLAASGGGIDSVASVASFFVSRIDTKVDTRIEELAGQGGGDLKALRGQAGIAVAKQVYQSFKAILAGERFAALARRGARVQRPLWGSTGTKNPAYSDILYVEELIGPQTVNTVPAATLAAFRDHGSVAPTLESGREASRRTLAALAAAGIDLGSITEVLQAEGVRLFDESLQHLLASIEQKGRRLAAAA